MNDTLQQQAINYIVKNFPHFTITQMRDINQNVRHRIIELFQLMQLPVPNLINGALNNKNLALKILSNEILYAKLGSYTPHIGREDASGSYHFFQANNDFTTGHNLFLVASSHEAARDYVLSQQEIFKAKFSPSQWQQLIDKSYIAEQQLQWRYSLMTT